MDGAEKGDPLAKRVPQKQEDPSFSSRTHIKEASTRVPALIRGDGFVLCFPPQYTVINTKTHNWSTCREEETVVCSASKWDICITPIPPKGSGISLEETS